MTKEEARDQIVIFMCDEQKVINDRDKQALDMAIEALKQPKIIYCKECKYYKKAKWENGKTYGTFCDRTHYEQRPYDFCSRAEVKND